MSRTIQTRLRTAHANTSKSITAADTCRATALSALTSTRRSPASVLQFRGFPAWESTTPTCRAPGVFVEGIEDNQEDYIPSGDGPGDDDPDGNDPDGDDPGGDDPEPHDEEEEGDPIGGLPGQDDARMIIFNNLSIAIDRLVHSAQSSNSSSSHTKVREPDTFDSTNPKKLHTFFIQCELNFQDRPKAFQTDRAKVTFAQSYLKGMALEWFKPDLLGMDDPDARPLWMTSWRETPIALIAMWSTSIELRPKFGDMVMALCIITSIPVSPTESRMRSAASVNRALSTDFTPSPKKSTPDTGNVRKRLLVRSEKSKSSSGNSAQPSSSSNPAPKKPGKTPKLSDKLSKDSKLTSEERKRRFEQNLCMFCGGSSHKAKECLKSGSRAAKARSATTTMTTMSEAKPTASTEAKK
ncbi:hypothetical protein SCLCIDRAFT_26353 [Scleroderma citrinum Foug A]|uniref:DUF4939 domain-containing protein n=1 Tax=Scleroderma citrinum Foug A TaxID=1036808 RepID=A0A0C3DJH0_9AGAM|nr:hypothetical protein SCLCIDRAFT_26353 [Scleroderma citrinum Foug A]